MQHLAVHEKHTVLLQECRQMLEQWKKTNDVESK